MSATAADEQRVSVIIPTHNRAALLPDALNSVLEQGPAVAEIIVVDDGSTDDTAAVIRRFTDPRIRYLQQPQSGPAVARDHGVRVATSPYLMFLDSDDALAPAAVRRLLETAVRHPGATPFGRASVHPETPLGPPDYTFEIAEHSGNLLTELSFYNSGTIFAALYPKDLLLLAGGFVDRDCCHDCEDYDLALRLALKTEFAYLPEVVYRIRMHAGNRHRDRIRRVWSCQRDAARRHLDRSGTRLLCRRVTAYFESRIAGSLLEEGLAAQAIKAYGRSLLLWPVKRAAWQGIFRSLCRRSGRAG